MLSLFDENYNDLDHLLIYIYLFSHSYISLVHILHQICMTNIILLKVIIFLASIMTSDI